MDLIQLMSKAGATAPITPYIFDTFPAATTCTDRTAFSLGAADVPSMVMQPTTLTPGAVPNASYTEAQITLLISVANQDSPKTRSLYVCLVLGATLTPASTSDIVLKMHGAMD